MSIITHIDKFFHNSPGAERYPGTPHFCGMFRYPYRYCPAWYLADNRKKILRIRRKPIRKYMMSPAKPVWLRPCRFLCAADWFRFVKWDADFSDIGKIDFNRDMFPSACFLRAVNQVMAN